MPKWFKWVLIVLGVIAIIAVVLSFVRSPDESEREITFSEMIAAGREGDIERIEVNGTRLDITLAGERDEWQSRMGRETDLVAALESEAIAVGGTNGVEVGFGRDSFGSSWWSLTINFVPLIMFVTILYFVLRNAVREGIRRADRDAAR